MSQPSRRASVIQRLAEEVGLTTLAAIQAQAVLHRPIPPRLMQRLNEAEIGELSPRERECMVLLAGGFKRQEIADELHISPETVKYHLRKAYRRLDAHTSIQAINAFLDRAA